MSINDQQDDVLEQKNKTKQRMRHCRVIYVPGFGATERYRESRESVKM